jgi:hypothetical protein
MVCLFIPSESSHLSCVLFLTSKRCFILDPPHLALGYPEPDYDKIYTPFTDPDYPSLEDTYVNFQHWVTSHYTHPDIASGKPSGLDYRKRTEHQTFYGWSDEQKALYLMKLPLFALNFLRELVYRLPGQVLTATIHHRYAPPMQALLKTQTYNALFNETLVASYFPDVHIFYISCASTCWFGIWTYMETSRLYKEAMKQGSMARTMSFHLVDDANHFVSVANCFLARYFWI